MGFSYFIKLFYALRKTGNNLTNLDSHIEFLSKCSNANIITKGFLKHSDVTYNDTQLTYECDQIQDEACWNIQCKVLNFLQNKTRIVQKEFKSLKRSLYQYDEIKAGGYFMKVKDEMKRLKQRLDMIKLRKWDNLRQYGIRYEKSTLPPDQQYPSYQHHSVNGNIQQKRHRRQRKRKMNVRKRNEKKRK